MKHKSLIFLCSSAIMLGIISKPSKTLSICADVLEVEYSNNAYQVHKYQDNVSNYFLSDSMYSASNRICLLKNSIRLKKPKNNTLTMTLEFSKDAYRCLTSGGLLKYYILDDDGNTLTSLDLSIYDDRDIELYQGDFSFYLNNNILMIELDCSSLPEYFIIAGNEYLNENRSFFLDLSQESPQNNYLKKFKLSNSPISDYKYTAPELGKYSGYEEIYYDGDEFYWEINYDNRLSVDQILSHIVAYDYGDDKELQKTVINDTYSQAVKENQLGNYKFDVSATDSQNHKSIITLNLEIKDLTAPSIVGDDILTISYTELNQNGTIDLANYYYGQDNYDGKIEVCSSTYSIRNIKDYDLYVYSSDSSNNIGSRLIKLKVIDDVDPTIEGPDTIDLYQFEVNNPEDLLAKYTFSDGDGSGIKQIGFEDNFPSDDLKKVGSSTHTIYCQDNFGNKAIKTVTINIKDGVGPVFFINAKSLSVTTSSKLTSDQVTELLMSNGNIRNKKYISSSFMDNEYLDNYNKEGTYDTKLVCYKEDGSRDFYKVKIEVKKAKEKNVFKSFFHLLSDFFTKIGRFFEYIWNLFLLGF